MIYTAVWTPLADDQLADLWIHASDRDAVTRAAKWIMQLLRVDPADKGRLVDGFYFFGVDPVGVWFELDDGDCMVRIVDVTWFRH